MRTRSIGIAAVALILFDALPALGDDDRRSTWTRRALESSVGLTGGITFAGDQDITMTRGHGAVLSESDKRPADIGPVAGVTATFWWSHFGLQLDRLYWHTSAQAQLPGSLKPVDVRQDRVALLMSLMGRLPLRERVGGPFAYGGLGGGFAVIGHHPGQTAVEPSVGALAGVAIPVASHFRVRAELRYLLTHDERRWLRHGISTEVSGNARGNPGHVLFGPHFDTQFVPLLIGLDYVF